MKNINIQNTAVLIVDMQDFFLKGFPEGRVEHLIKQQCQFLDFCAVKGLPVFVLEYDKRGPTTRRLQSALKKVVDKYFVIKKHNSGFRDTELDILLEERGVKKVILMGVNGNGCVQDTAIGALKRGYSIMTSADIIASNTKRDERLATSRKWFSKNGDFFETVDELFTSL